MTLIDGLLASAVLAGLLLNALANWWWADPLAGYVLVYYGGLGDPARRTLMQNPGLPAVRSSLHRTAMPV